MDQLTFNASILLIRVFVDLRLTLVDRQCFCQYVLMLEGMQNQVCLIFSMHVQYANKLSVAMNKSLVWVTIDTEEVSTVLV